MHTHKGQNGRINVWFYFYAPKVCLKEERVLYQGEWTKVEIAAERMMTVFPIHIKVKWQDNELVTQDGAMADGGYKILRTEAGEEVLLVIKAKEQDTFLCGRVFLSERRIITIGTSFQYDVFYEYSSFLREKKILLYRDGEAYILECMTEKDVRKNFAIYVNGSVAESRTLLTKGDRIEVLGLCILVLPQMLVCISFYGVLRMAERKEKNQLLGADGYKSSAQVYGVRHGFLSQEKLKEEEVEIELPELERKETKQPLFLAVGPSLTMVIPTLLMMLTGKLFLGQSSSGFYGMTVVVTMASAFLTVFWMMLNRFYHNKTVREENRKREREYTVYLKQTENYLANREVQNRKILMDRYPTAAQITGLSEGIMFWNRGIGRSVQSDRIIRLGSGEVCSPITVKVSGRRRISGHTPLAESAYQIADRYQCLKDMPVGIVLKDGGNTGFVGENSYPFLLQMLVQISSYYGCQELKLVYFYHENFREEKEIAECLKWLPQIWQEGKKKRFLAGNAREAGEILPYLTEKMQNRSEVGAEKNEFYLFIITNEELIKGEQIYSFLTGRQKVKGYHAVFVGYRKEQIPGSVNQMVIKAGPQEEIMNYEKGVWERQKVTLEGCEVKPAERYMRKLACEQNSDGHADAELPDKVSFLDLYSCHNVEELHILGRWEENEAAERIRVPIGIGGGRRLMYLDVHEKFHGPHGLIAGTTGAGKSELLQTYLLSLAVSFGPEAVNFFIIDYKGGGMGIGLGELLHCAGVISNLSGAQIKRALLSIKSENTRRQLLLSQAGVSHVDEYSKLYREKKVKEPMPHLILVVDEFAELKKEEPAFMQEIISIAQIGRSLGIHLILATQKPAGTIDDKIWSNSRFRLCLRVADKQDSMDMLKRPEAAYLTGAGRCYLQIGNNEIFEVLQTGYSKAPYEKETKQEKAVLISATGKRYEKQSPGQVGQKKQLETVIDYINHIGTKAGYKKAKKLWMNELSERLILDEIKEEEVTDMRFCVGVYDDPYSQRQEALYYVPAEGHLCLCGMPASGKSTFLQTLLWQVCRKYSPLQLQFVLITPESAGISCFTQMPHCMGYMKQAQEAESFFYHLEAFFKKRKKQLGGISFEQAKKRQNKRLCPVLVMIDDYGFFRELTEDRYYGVLERLFREGIQNGIYLVLTALGAGGGELPGRLFEKVKQTMTLAMSDKVQYADVLRQYQIPVEPSPDIKGRGLCRADGKILEFQVPLFADADDYERIRMVEQLAGKLRRETDCPEELHLHRFPRIPDKASWEKMLSAWAHTERSNEKIPIGYEIRTGYIREISIKEHFPFLISGDTGEGTKRVLHCLLSAILQGGLLVTVFSENAQFIKETADERITVLKDADSFYDWYQNVVNATEKKVSVLVIEELADFAHMLQKRNKFTPDMIQKLEEEIKQKKIYLLAKSRTQAETELLGTFWYELFVQKQCGLHMGGNAAGQRIFSFDDLGYAQLGKKENEGIGYLKLGCAGETQKVLIPKAEGEEEDDIG